MLRKFAEGKIKQKILLPGSNFQGTISKLQFESDTSGTLKDSYDNEGKNYVNSSLKDCDGENKEYEKVILSTTIIYYFIYFLKIKFLLDICSLALLLLC